MNDKAKKTLIEQAVDELHKRGGFLTSNPASREIVISCTDGGTSKQFQFAARALYSCANCSEDLYVEFETPAPAAGKLSLKKIEQALAQTAGRGDTELLAVREFEGKLYFALASQGHAQGWKTGDCGTLCLPPGPASAVGALRLLVDMLASHDKKLRAPSAKLQDRALLLLRQIAPERLMEGLRRVAAATFSTEVTKEYLVMARSPLDDAPPLFLMKLDHLKPGYGADQDAYRIQRMVGVLQEVVSAAPAVKPLTAGAPGVSSLQATHIAQ